VDTVTDCGRTGGPPSDRSGGPPSPPRRHHVVADAAAAGALPEHRHVAAVAAKGADVLADPAQRRALVLQPVVACTRHHRARRPRRCEGGGAKRRTATAVAASSATLCVRGEELVCVRGGRERTHQWRLPGRWGGAAPSRRSPARPAGTARQPPPRAPWPPAPHRHTGGTRHRRKCTRHLVCKRRQARAIAHNSVTHGVQKAGRGAHARRETRSWRQGSTCRSLRCPELVERTRRTLRTPRGSP
jgi:hypothetical protein